VHAEDAARLLGRLSDWKPAPMLAAAVLQPA